MSDKKLELSEKTISMLEQVSVADFIDLFIKYPIVTRKLLLIRPKLPGDGYTMVTHKAAGLVKQKAKDAGWTVDNLEGNNATTENILKAIKKKPDFVVYYGHSLNIHNIPGQKNNQLEVAISPGNVGVLLGRTLSTVACYLAKVLGPAAIKAKVVAFLGYKTVHTVFTVGKLLDDFIEGSNAANYALLEGKKYEEAYQIGWNAYDQKWLYWSTLQKKGLLTPEGKKICPLALAAFLNNRDGLTRLGNPKGVARPIGIVVTT